MNDIDEMLEGLLTNQKFISSKFLYDEEGTRLFEEITKLDEYYITRCEKEILYHNAEAFINLASNERFNLIELGPGDGSKAGLLIAAFLRAKKNFDYHGIDISPQALKRLSHNLKQKFPSLNLHTVLADYAPGIGLISAQQKSQNIVLFLGSSIGNLLPPDGSSFMQNLASQIKEEDYLIVGFDLKKEERVLWRAYNDTKGLTADFNLNLLNRLNNEFGANFNLNNFKHFEIYNPELSAMESYLISNQDQTIHFDDGNIDISFGTNEMIHTEYSFKYNKKTILDLIKNTNLAPEHFLYDSKNYVTIVVFKKSSLH